MKDPEQERILCTFDELEGLNPDASVEYLITLTADVTQVEFTDVVDALYNRAQRNTE